MASIQIDCSVDNKSITNVYILDWFPTISVFRINLMVYIHSGLHFHGRTEVRLFRALCFFKKVLIEDFG